jgi:hypothetical protein
MCIRFPKVFYIMCGWPFLAHILVGECFPFNFLPWMTKCKEGGLTKPHKCVSTKVGACSTKACTYRDQGECHFGNFIFEIGAKEIWAVQPKGYVVRYWHFVILRAREIKEQSFKTREM